MRGSHEDGEERPDDEEGALRAQGGWGGGACDLCQPRIVRRATKWKEGGATHREEVPPYGEAERARDRPPIGREDDALHRDGRGRRLERVLGERLVVLDYGRRVEQLRFQRGLSRSRQLSARKKRKRHREGEGGRTSKMYFLPTRSSLFHPVRRQNSVPTRQISPVRRHTTVGVPENETSLLSSTRVRWKVRSTKVCECWGGRARVRMVRRMGGLGGESAPRLPR